MANRVQINSDGPTGDHPELRQMHEEWQTVLDQWVKDCQGLDSESANREFLRRMREFMATRT